LLESMFNIFELLLMVKEVDVFEKALQLLNLVENNKVLLLLGKLYYKHKFYNLAYNEFVRSIKLFDVMDSEGLILMEKCINFNKRKGEIEE